MYVAKNVIYFSPARMDKTCHLAKGCISKHATIDLLRNSQRLVHNGGFPKFDVRCSS